MKNSTGQKSDTSRRSRQLDPHTLVVWVKEMVRLEQEFPPDFRSLVLVRHLRRRTRTSGRRLEGEFLAIPFDSPTRQAGGDLSASARSVKKRARFLERGVSWAGYTRRVDGDGAEGVASEDNSEQG